MRATFVLHADLFRPSPIFRATKEIAALRRAGFSCSAVCWIKREADLPTQETVDGVEIQRLFFRPSPQRATHLVQRYLELRRVTRSLAARVQATKPDLIVAHDLEILSAALRAAKALDVPVIYDAHEDWPAMVGETSRLEGFLSAVLERRLCRRVAAAVTSSDMITDRFRSWGVAAQTLHNAPYRAEVEPLPSPAELARTRLELNAAERFVIGYVGTLAPKRGLELVVESLGSLPPEVVFVVVGGPESEVERIRALSRTLGVSDRVRFVGRVPRADVSRYTAAFDVAVVLPPPVSRNYLTTLPNKAYDYMAAGVPIIASDLPSLRRTLHDEAGCAVTIPPSPAALRKAVEDLEHDPTRRRDLGRRGQDAFLDRFAWDHQEARFLAVVREAGVRLPSAG